MSDIPRTPNQDRGEGSQKRNRRPDIPSGDFSPSKKQRPDKRNRPGPILRIPIKLDDSDLQHCNLLLGPEEVRYSARVLNPDEVDPMNPVLRISNDYQHFVFLNDPSFLENPDFAGSIPYRVYDEYIRQYNMTLSRTDASLSEWATIVRDCGLRTGDKVCFTRYLDTRVSNDFVYILVCKRYPPLDDGNYEDDQVTDLTDESTSSTANPVLRILYNRLPLVTKPEQGPGSRDFPPKGHCISKTLTWVSTVSGGTLILSATDAVKLTDNPRILVLPTGRNYEKDIQVFDEVNHEYTMTVKALSNPGEGEFKYSLGGDQWTTFVTRHNLLPGDELMIYECLHSTFPSRYYHVFRHVSNNDLVSATAADGKTQSAENASDQKRNVPEGSGSR